MRPPVAHMSLLLVRQVSIHVEHLVIAVRHKRMDLLAVKRHVFCVDVCLDRDNTSDQQSTNAAPEVLAITSEGASSSCCSVQGTNCQALKAASARTQAHRGFSISGRHAVTCFHFGTIAVRSAKAEVEHQQCVGNREVASHHGRTPR